MTMASVPESWRTSGLRWYWVVVLTIIMDQVSKQWILTHFSLYESVNVLPFFNIVYVRNYGAAFSFLSDAGGWQRWLFTLIAVGFSLVLTLWLRRQSASLWKLNLAYTLIIGGAIGNLIDRLMYGFVVDFLDFFWKTHHYPAFNVADSAICVGAALIIWDALVGQKDSKDKSSSGTSKIS